MNATYILGDWARPALLLLSHHHITLSLGLLPVERKRVPIHSFVLSCSAPTGSSKKRTTQARECILYSRRFFQVRAAPAPSPCLSFTPFDWQTQTCALCIVTTTLHSVVQSSTYKLEQPFRECKLHSRRFGQAGAAPTLLVLQHHLTPCPVAPEAA